MTKPRKLDVWETCLVVFDINVEENSNITFDMSDEESMCIIMSHIFLKQEVKNHSTIVLI